MNFYICLYVSACTVLLIIGCFWLYFINNKLDNVIIVPAACSDSISISSFSLGANYALGHLNETNNRWERKSGDVVVPTIMIDEVVRRMGVLPNVMKIDVEGAEFRVLQGARDTLLKVRPIIFLSTHSSDLRTSCLDHLERMNYVFEPLNNTNDGSTEFLVKPK